MVVDDTAFMRSVLKNMIVEEFAYTVIEASTGQNDKHDSPSNFQVKFFQLHNARDWGQDRCVDFGPSLFQLYGIQARRDRLYQAFGCRL